jgi:hypothetical protein
MPTHTTPQLATMSLSDLLEGRTSFDIHAFPPPSTPTEEVAYNAALAADNKLREFYEGEDGNHAKLHQLESETLATLLRYQRILASRTDAPAA